MRFSTLLAFAFTTLGFGAAASAQEAPPPASAVAPHGEYVTPMQQQTQQTYVPQSVALSGPSVIKDWSDGDAIPSGYHRATRTRTGLIVGGAVTFGTMYVISAFVAAGSIDSNKYCTPDRYTNCQSASALFAPVVGPFIEMGRTGRGSATGQTALALDGVAQLAGAAMLIGGIALPRVVLVRNDLATGETKERASFQPYVAAGGVGVLGRF